MARKSLKMPALTWIAIILLIVGGLNWGLIGVANFNLVEFLFGTGYLAKTVYSVVGASAVYSTFALLNR
jgi:uncharacterized membrane protein YuzA (DUF378 family)